MRALSPTSKYRKDIKRQVRRQKDIQKIEAVIEELQNTGTLSDNYLPHKLTGDWVGLWECHIEPDWLLIYDVTDEEVILVRTGTHSDLFG